MGIFDKAKDAAKGHEEQVGSGIDKGTDALSERTGGKYDEHIDKGGDFAKGQFGAGEQGGAPEGGAPEGGAPEGGAPEGGAPEGQGGFGGPEGGAPEAPPAP